MPQGCAYVSTMVHASLTVHFGLTCGAHASIGHGRRYGKSVRIGPTRVRFPRTKRRPCLILTVTLTVCSVFASAGEVDILEGVNDQSPNQATLHTNSGEYSMASPAYSVLKRTPE